MIIELFGMPGAGKTTVAQRLSKEHGYVVIKIDGIGELLRYVSLFSFRHPIRFVRLFGYVLWHSRNLRMIHYKVMNLLLHTIAKYEKARAYDKALIDQGSFQAAISLFEEVTNIKSMRAYLKLNPMPDKLYVFELPEAVQETRLLNRHYIVREESGEEAFRERLRIMRKNFELFVAQIDSIRVSTVRIDASGTPGNIYETIVRSLH